MLVITRKTDESIVIGRSRHALMLFKVEQIGDDRVWLGMVGDESRGPLHSVLNGLGLNPFPKNIELRIDDEFAVGNPPFLTVRLVTIKGDRVRLAVGTSHLFDVHRHETWRMMSDQ